VGGLIWGRGGEGGGEGGEVVCGDEVGGKKVEGKKTLKYSRTADQYRVSRQVMSPGAETRGYARGITSP